VISNHHAAFDAHLIGIGSRLLQTTKDRAAGIKIGSKK